MRLLKEIYFLVVLMTLFIGCTKENIGIKTYVNPDFISFKLENDSLYVTAKNENYCPSFFKIVKIDEGTIQKITLKAKSSKRVLSFLASKIDSSMVKSQFFFTQLLFGDSEITSHDTDYNYEAPFLKGKKHLVTQENNTNSTHQGAYKYALDIDMKEGETICAMREGLVVKVIQNYNESGVDEKYFNKGNLITIYHSDGTFTSYAHLKQKGSLVKEGDTIIKGQPIGLSGNTGMSSGPHLHFVVSKPTENGLVSMPYILNSIPSEQYKKDQYVFNN